MDSVVYTKDINMAATNYINGINKDFAVINYLEHLSIKGTKCKEMHVKRGPTMALLGPLKTATGLFVLDNPDNAIETIEVIYSTNYSTKDKSPSLEFVLRLKAAATLDDHTLLVDKLSAPFAPVNGKIFSHPAVAHANFIGANRWRIENRVENVQPDDIIDVFATLICAIGLADDYIDTKPARLL